MSQSATMIRNSGNTGRQPVPLAHEAIHDTALSILKPLARAPLRAVPAGECALAARLIDAGFDVRCCDLYPGIFRLDGVAIHRGNLDAELPFSDHSFEYITCLEGLEHIENPQQAMREFARMLKPGGHLIVSVPNILNIEERLKWLIHGYTSHFKPISRAAAERLRVEYDDRVEIAAHVNPISYSELRYILEKHGFEVLTAHRDKAKANAWLYWPLVGIIKLIAKLHPP